MDFPVSALSVKDFKPCSVHKNNEMLVILKNVMNDLHARGTSSKIRAVKQSAFRSGKYIRGYAPIAC